MSLFRESADVSVRPAVAEADVLLAGLQLRAWSATHQETLGRAVLDALQARSWRPARRTSSSATAGRTETSALSRNRLMALAGYQPMACPGSPPPSRSRADGQGCRLPASAASDRLTG